MGKVGILFHDQTSPAGTIITALEQRHIAYDIYDVREQPLPPGDMYTAIVILGGGQHVYELENFPYLEPEFAYIQHLIAQNIPILGICLGAQLLAAALDARVYQHTLTEIGFYEVEITAEGQQDPLFKGFPASQKVFHWHQDSFTLPAGATLLCTHPNASQQAFRYGHNAYGTQYHIELDQAALDSWLYDPSSKESIVKSIGDDAYHAIEQERSLYFSTYRAQADMLFENFLRISNLIC